MQLSRQQERPIMVTLQPGGTPSPLGSMWLMHRCFRLAGSWKAKGECVEQVGLLDSARVSRHCRDAMHGGRPLHRKGSLEDLIFQSSV